MHENRGKSFFSVPWTRKCFPLILNAMNGVLENVMVLCTVFLKTTTWYLMFILYHAFIRLFWDTFFHCYAQTVFWGL